MMFWFIHVCVNIFLFLLKFETGTHKPEKWWLCWWYFCGKSTYSCRFKFWPLAFSPRQHKGVKSTLQTRLDLYNSLLALASSPVLFWNLCVQLEIWISIVICGLAAVVGQASKASPSPHSVSPLSSYVTAASCAKALSALPSTPPSIPHLTIVITIKKLCTLYVIS